jgi:hypothetical protein
MRAVCAWEDGTDVLLVAEDDNGNIYKLTTQQAENLISELISAVKQADTLEINYQKGIMRGKDAK